MIYRTLGLILALIPTVALATNSSRSREIGIPILNTTPTEEGRALAKVYYRISKAGRLVFRREIEVTVGRFGCSLKPLPTKEQEGREEPYLGLRVARVETDSPAFKAGLQKDDVILYFNDEAVGNPRRFRFLIQQHDINFAAKIVFERRGEKKQAEVFLEPKTITVVDHRYYPLGTFYDRQHSGGTFAELEGETLRYFFEEPGEGGVLVCNILPGSPLFRSAVRKGDIVTAVDGERVTTVDSLVRALRRVADDRDRCRLALRRGGKLRTAEFCPKRSIGSGFKFSIPIVMSWSKRPERTQFSLVWGLVFDYERKSRFTSQDEPIISRSWSLPLSLVDFESDGRKRTFSLLWLIKFRY